MASLQSLELMVTKAFGGREGERPERGAWPECEKMFQRLREKGMTCGIKPGKDATRRF